MEFGQIAQNFKNQIVDEITRNIYNEIVREYIIYAIKVGIIAGLIIAAVGILLGVMRFSSLDLTTYMGCMLTGQNKGKTSFIAGFLVHMFFSAFFGVFYLYLIHTFNIPGTLPYAFALGVAHTLFSGAFMLIFDKLNVCTRNGRVPVMGFMVRTQGPKAMIAYAITHILFVVIVVTLLTK